MKNQDIADIVSRLQPNDQASITRYIESLEGERKDVMLLGKDEFFALKDNDGDVRALKRRVRLTAAAGHLVQIVSNGPYVLTAKGYEYIANEGGIQVVMPTTVVVDGTQQPNPYMTRDRETGRILSCCARAIAYRYSPTGMPQVMDWTTIFDIPSYRLQDLIAKAKKTPQAFKLLPNNMTPDNGSGEAWARYPFDIATSLWVNTAQKEAIDWYSNLIGREKKIIDTGQTFARRNAVKHLVGLSEVPYQRHKEPREGREKGTNRTFEYMAETYTPIPVWDLELTIWLPKKDGVIRWNGSQYAQLRAQLEEITTGGSENPQKVEVVGVRSEEISEEEAIEQEVVDAEFEVVAPVPSNNGQKESLQKEPESTLNTENKSTPEAPEPEIPNQQQPSVQTANQQNGSDDAFRRRLWDNFKAIKKNFPEEYAQAVQLCGGEEKTASKQWIMEILARVNEIVDTKAAA